jgi:adenylate kinase family enzyme
VDRQYVIEAYKDFYQLNDVPPTVKQAIETPKDDVFVASLFDADFVHDHITSPEVINIVSKFRYYDKSNMAMLQGIPFLETYGLLSVDTLRLIAFQYYVVPTIAEPDKVQYVFGKEPQFLQKLLDLHTCYSGVHYMVINNIPKERPNYLQAHIIVGVPHAGKTTFAHQLQEKVLPNSLLIDSDKYIDAYAEQHHISFREAYDSISANNLWDHIDEDISQNLIEAQKEERHIIICRTGLTKKERDKISNLIGANYDKNMNVMILSLDKALELNDKDVNRRLPEEQVIYLANRASFPRPYEYTNLNAVYVNHMAIDKELQLKQIHIEEPSREEER